MSLLLLPLLRVLLVLPLLVLVLGGLLALRAVADLSWSVATALVPPLRVVQTARLPAADVLAETLWVRPAGALARFPPSSKLIAAMSLGRRHAAGGVGIVE